METNFFKSKCASPIELGKYYQFPDIMPFYYKTKIDFLGKWENALIVKNNKKNQSDCFSIQNQTIAIDILGTIYKLPIELSDIANQIIEAKGLLKFKKNWDENGAEQTNVETLLNAFNFVVSYSKEIFRLSNIIITTPYIDIARDGSIYVHFENPNTKFLIIFKKGFHSKAYYYGERLDNNISFKSAIENKEGIDEILLLWMKKHLQREQ